MSIFKKIIRFLKAIKKYAGGGFKNVTLSEYTERLNICAVCPEQENGICKKCGCFLSKKAWWSTEDCPIDKWPKQQ